ncbi:hypothetical protein J5619_22220, partial [Enterobacter ludwigii]|nr:hypothetical protein [Enterobacter ludwigii]
GGTADRNRSHWSTSKTPSYTKSVSWHHYQIKNEFLTRIRHIAPEIDVLESCGQNTIVYQSRHYVRNNPRPT